MDVGAVSTIPQNHIQVLWHPMSGPEAYRDPFCIYKTFIKGELQFSLHKYAPLSWKGVILEEVTPYEAGHCPTSDRRASQKRVLPRKSIIIEVDLSVPFA